MKHQPVLNTPTTVQSTYASPRGFKQSYKVSAPALNYSNDFRVSYHRNGDSSVRDNWILGKGSTADGWDGWSLVHGEKRYWDSKLQKPEYRGKCGGAAANRLSEEQILKRLRRNQLPDLTFPKGKLKSEVLRERRKERIDGLSDQLFKEYFPDIAPPSPRAPEPNNTRS